MPIELTIERQTLRFDTDTLGIGRAPENQISLPNDVRLERLHATLKLVNGRWIIESREGGPVRIGDGRPVRFAWLNSGDTIHLTESGPEIVIQVSGSAAGVIAAPAIGALVGFVRPSPMVLPTPLPVTSPAVRPAQKREGDQSAASPPFIPADGISSWKPILIAGSIAALFVGMVGWIAWQRSMAKSPKTDLLASADDADRLDSHSSSPPQPLAPIADMAKSACDPSDLLVLIGVGDLIDDNRPYLVGVGWLWTKRTVVIPRVLGKNLEEVIEKTGAERIACKVCVIQGIPLEVEEIVNPPNTADISFLKLKQPAEAELSFSPRDIWQAVTVRKVQRMIERGNAISYYSFAQFPKSSEISEGNGFSLLAYDPERIRLKKERARFEHANGGHFLKPDGMERGGLLVDQDRKIIGMTLLESSVVWTAELERVLGN